ncbi:2185_t:CDS:1 [Cetraspora pellucida]|uniref:2185_t:CDS:1 n=1 Tax=Cetraspora pellucida TaxID=1433469 RepID=A0ACA9LVR8_9GLOM|nr:2185_t:CDS:1 [Cetraspora pellucida]
MRFNNFLDIVDDLYLNLIKIYFCTLEENEINTTNIEIYNSKFENSKLFYFKDHILLLNKLKELSSFEQISFTMKYYDLPIRKRKTDNFIKFFEKEIEFNYLYPVVYTLKFKIFNDYQIGYSGVDYYGKYNNQHFVIHDECDHFKRNIMNLEKINTYLKEFNDATNDIFHENCHKLFIINDNCKINFDTKNNIKIVYLKKELDKEIINEVINKP